MPQGKPAKRKAGKSKSGASKSGKTKSGASKSGTSKTARGKAGAAKPATVAAPRELAEGAAAPAFSLPRDGGATVSLADFKGRKLVLYFYPKADTAGCTREALDFSRLRAKFASAGAAILGVSADPVSALDKFKTKHALAVDLASDETHRMLAAYGAWGEKAMYGRKFMGVIRKTVLIGETGRVLRVWPRVKVEGHADEVLAAVKAG